METQGITVAQESHEYLIDQLQITGTDSITLSENNSNTYRMNFNHPTKEIVWVFQRSVNAPQNGGNVATNDWLIVASKNQWLSPLVSVF